MFHLILKFDTFSFALPAFDPYSSKTKSDSEMYMVYQKYHPYDWSFCIFAANSINIRQLLQTKGSRKSVRAKRVWSDWYLNAFPFLQLYLDCDSNTDRIVSRNISRLNILLQFLLNYEVDQKSFILLGTAASDGNSISKFLLSFSLSLFLVSLSLRPSCQTFDFVAFLIVFSNERRLTFSVIVCDYIIYTYSTHIYNLSKKY